MKRVITILFCISLCFAFADMTSMAIAQDSCEVSLLKDTMLKSRWVPRPALMRIKTAHIAIGQDTQVTYTSDDASEEPFKSIIPLAKMVNKVNGMINQLVIIMPASLTGNIDGLTETVTVAVDGCEQTCCCNLEIRGLRSIPSIE